MPIDLERLKHLDSLFHALQDKIPCIGTSLSLSAKLDTFLEAFPDREHDNSSNYVLLNFYPKYLTQADLTLVDGFLRRESKVDINLNYRKSLLQPALSNSIRTCWNMLIQ